MICLKGGPEPSDLCLVNVNLKYFSNIFFGTSKFFALNRNIGKYSWSFHLLISAGKGDANMSCRCPFNFRHFCYSKIAQINVCMWYWNPTLKETVVRIAQLSERRNADPKVLRSIRACSPKVCARIPFICFNTTIFFCGNDDKKKLKMPYVRPVLPVTRTRILRIQRPALCRFSCCYGFQKSPKKLIK